MIDAALAKKCCTVLHLACPHPEAQNVSWATMD